MELKEVTCTQLLPFLPSIVASVLGARVAEVMVDPSVAAGTVITSYLLWGMGVPMALFVMIVYWQRLVLYKTPLSDVIVSTCIPLGPLGFGGYSVLSLGKIAQKVFPTAGILGPNAQLVGDGLYVIGLITSLVFWGFGLIWMSFAATSIISARPWPFNLSWWSATFPLGTFAASAILLGQELPSTFFKIAGIILIGVLLCTWTICAIGSIWGCYSGSLFSAQSLNSPNCDICSCHTSSVLSKDASEVLPRHGHTV